MSPTLGLPAVGSRGSSSWGAPLSVGDGTGGGGGGGVGSVGGIGGIGRVGGVGGAGGPRTLTPFIAKLHHIVHGGAPDALVSWVPNGRAFVVHAKEEFAAAVLPSFFKHAHFASFVRQLNKYGFHKASAEAWVFSHPCFVRGAPHLLGGIMRHRRCP